MSSKKYPIGTKVQSYNFIGEVIKNFKFPGDICVKWGGSLFISSYDEWWLDENTTIIKESK